VIVWVAPPLVAHRIGSGKGRRHSWAWGLLSWIGVGIIALLPARGYAPGETPVAGSGPDSYQAFRPVGLSGRHKTCPECLNEVREEARLCRECGYRFSYEPAALVQ
jgi:hypothetical protein